jgi:hypothetical protein
MGDIRRLRSSAIWLVLIVAVIALWFLVVNDNDSTTNKDFSAVAADIQDGTVQKLTIGEDSNTVRVQYIDPWERSASCCPRCFWSVSSSSSCGSRKARTTRRFPLAKAGRDCSVVTSQP